MRRTAEQKLTNMMMYIGEQKEFTTEYARLYGLTEKQIDKLEQHLDFRERVILRKDEVIEKLLNAHLDLTVKP